MNAQEDLIILLTDVRDTLHRIAAAMDPRDHHPSRYLSPADVCALLPGMTEDTLASRRKQRLEPPFYKPTGARGGVVLYDRADIVAWVRGNRVETRSTS